MKFMKLLLTSLGLSIFLSACTPFVLKSEFESVPIISGRFEISEAVALTRHANAVGVLYFDAENRLVLRQADGGAQVLNESFEKDARRAYATLHSDGQWLYALWRPKLIRAVDGVGQPGDKLVYFRASQDGGKSFGPIQRLNQKGGAFKPFVASSGTGDVYVAYTDERNSGTNIDIYFNVSHNYGSNWRAEEVKINGDESRMSLNPSVVADGSRVSISWMTRNDAGEFKIFVRSSEDRGENWMPPVAVHTSTSQPGMPQMVQTAQGLLMCWMEGDSASCALSKDSGKFWSASQVIEDSNNTAGLYLAVDPKAVPHLLLARTKDQDKKRVNLFHTYAQNGVEFGRPIRISGGEPFAASAVLPVQSFGEDGSMLVAWVDLRYLRPVIATNFSADGGKSWLTHDVILAAKSSHYHFFPVASYAGNGTYTVAWHESTSRTNQTSNVGMRNFQADTSGTVMAAPNAERLKERVDGFWSMRKQGKWDNAYDFLDPFMREGIGRAQYVKSQGSVTYFGHKLIGEPQISGVRGTVQVSYDSEVPELMLKGKKITVPRQEVEIAQEWIWVDGDWYHVFRDIMGGGFLLE